MNAHGTTVRTIPLRKWLLIGFFILMHVPLLAMAAFAVAWIRGPHSYHEQATSEVRNSTALWDDPAWRTALEDEFDQRDIHFVLTEGDTVIYQSVADPFVTGDGSERSVMVNRVVLSGSDPQRVFYIYGDEDFGPPDELPLQLVLIVGAVAFILTLVGIGIYLGRTVIGPLSAAGETARQVAAGNLDVMLPPSRIHEVNELNSAINSMSVDLRESLQQQAAMDQERRLMIGAVVHDLRTPLFALRGYLEGLETGVADTPEKQRRYITVAQEKADALERLISDLFSFTRLEYLEETPVREPLDLRELMQALVNGVSPQAEAKGVRVELTTSGNCPVQGDRHLLTRAVENLLDNAIRHTPAGGTVTVECRNDDERSVFSVFDTGPGIPEADLPQLFMPLFRGETSRNRRTGGAGLGLTIARRILRAHGGDLDAANMPEGGAKFVGWIPLHGDAQT